MVCPVNSISEDLTILWLINDSLGPNGQAYKASRDSQIYQTYTMQRNEMFTSAEHVDIDQLSYLDEIDGYNESSQGYDTSCTSFAFPEDFSDIEEAVVPYQNPATYLSCIGHWVEDHSSSGTTWTVRSNPNVLLQHACRFNAASVEMKPHIEEAMACFQVSFYGARGVPTKHQFVEHR